MKRLILCVLLICGCDKPVSPVNNSSGGKVVAPDAGNVSLGLLFETQDGTKVYRFTDCGNYHYLAVKGDCVSIGK